MNITTKYYDSGTIEVQVVMRNPTTYSGTTYIVSAFYAAPSYYTNEHTKVFSNVRDATDYMDEAVRKLKAQPPDSAYGVFY